MYRYEENNVTIAVVVDDADYCNGDKRIVI